MHSSERNENFEHNLWNNFIKNIDHSDVKFYPNLNKTYNIIKKYFKIKSIENIIIGTGSDRIIKYIYECFVSKGSEVISTSPCFPMYDVYSKLYNSKLIKVKYNKMKVDIDKITERVNQNTSLVILSNPSSPVGDIIDKNKLIILLKKCLKNKNIVVIDEAYIEFSNSKSLINEIYKYPNLFVTRTFSKAFGSAGVRCGFGVSSAKNIKIINKFRDMYEISGLTLVWINTLLKNKKKLKSYFLEIKKNRIKFYDFLKRQKFNVLNSESNWLHVQLNKKNSLLNNKNFLIKKNVNLPLKDDKNWVTISIPDTEKNLKKLFNFFK